MAHDGVGLISGEFASAELGDKRRLARLMRFADHAAALPGGSLPDQADGDSELEATYRFLGNEDVSPEAVAEAHIRCTVGRAAAHERVLVIHDTTEFRFGGEVLRQGLGRLNSDNQQGFLAHVSLCVSPIGEPLGLLGLYTWVRESKRKGHRSQTESQSDPDRESLRWHDAVHSTTEQLHGYSSAIHVMDREGDSYELFADMVEHGQGFVTRLCHDRRLDKDTRNQSSRKLFAELAQAPVVMTRDVALSPRKTRSKSRAPASYPARAARQAKLELRSQPIEFAIGNGASAHLPPTLSLNFVEVREADVPDDQEPVLWRLVTTEPIDTPEQVAAVVDAYRTRWLIEEYFKALKTGCNYESLQLESAHALMVALAVYCAVAWRLLHLRWLERTAPETPAEYALTSVQLAVLKAVRKQRNRPLPERATVSDVLLAIAALGGHLKRNGPPGWLILNRGFNKLLTYEIGWRAARASEGDVINH
jgi:hypothetical protein